MKRRSVSCQPSVASMANSSIGQNDPRKETTKKTTVRQSKKCLAKVKEINIIPECLDDNNSSIIEENEANLTDNEHFRTWYANLTDKREKRSEYRRRYLASLTEEQRELRRVNSINYKRKMRAETRSLKVFKNPEDRRRKTKIKKIQSFKNNKIFRIACYPIRRADVADHFSKRPKDCPLQNLIEQMVNGSVDVKIMIDRLNKNLVLKILKLFAHDYPDSIPHRCNYTFQSMNYVIDATFLTELLRRWEGWTVNDRINYLLSNKGYNDLFLYLLSNFKDYKTQRDKSLQDELNEFGNTESYITVTCSMNELQSLFYHSPHNYTNYFQESIDYCTFRKLNTPFSNYVINWPYVSTRITLPYFSMTHENIHVDEYDLIDITNLQKTNPVNKENTSLLLKLSNVNVKCEVYLKNNVQIFLSQLKSTINNCGNDEMSFERKYEMLTTLLELEKDIALCSDSIESNAKYYNSLTPYAYTRYLGYSDDRNVNMSIAEQKSLKSSILNVRLRQIHQPNISFSLDNFSMPVNFNSDAFNFEFYKSLMHRINNCITYKCILCDEPLGSYSPSQTIFNHMLRYHGLEPDWECVNCNKSFPNDYLLENRWSHECE